jgi:hypothetical protein
MVALMAAQTNVPTDYNPGSNVRTLDEALGSVIEIQAVSDQALSFQALAYGAMSLFGVLSAQATFATGTVTMATSFPVVSAQPTTQAVLIPSGTLVQTAGSIQFATIGQATLASGTSSVSVGVIASLAGSAGNVAASAITGLPITSIGYPLYVANGAPTGGGNDAGTQSSALAQFTARQASLGLSSPVAVANSPIGVTVSGTGEMVMFAAAFEPWLAAGSGMGSGTAGWILYIDNGTGGASSSLIAAVDAWITGNASAGQSGFRPVGVPYQVLGVTPVYASVAASGSLIPGLFSSGTVPAAAASGIQAYFNALGISAPSPGGSTGLNAASQPQIAARVADAGAGSYASLAVTLTYSAASGTPVPIVSGGVGTRVILNSLTVNIQ